MNNKPLLSFITVVAALLAPYEGHATSVSFDVTHIAGNTWEDTYTVANDMLAVDIEELTVFFDVGLFENLSMPAAPADWDPLVIQSDPGLPDDGFYDALALVAGIAPGDSLGGFSVRFDFLGGGTLGSQPFDIVDPFTFAALDWSSPGLVEGLGLSFHEGVLAPTFVLKGGQIVQGRVSTMGVVPRLDEFEDGHAGLGRGLKPGAIQQLALQGGEEGLGHGVVIAIPDRAHRGAYPGGLTAVSEGDGGVLTALIGVVDDLLWPALGESHLQGIEHQLGPQVGGHRPSHHPPAEGVQDHRQVEEPGPGRNVGDIRDPELVRCLGREVALHEVRCGTPIRVTQSGMGSLAPAHPLQAQPAHQPGDPIATDLRFRFGELRMHPRHPISAAGARMDALDLPA
jgi:hypothetical protein